MRGFRFTFWESVLVLVGILLFSISALIYVTDFPLRRYFYRFDDEEGKEQIGYVLRGVGDVKRQASGAMDFDNVKVGTPLFHFDILVTGPTSSASLSVQDGSIIEISPNTMIRLAFHSEVTLTGIHKFGQLDVVTGSVTSKTRNQKLVVTHQGEVFTISPHTKQALTIRESLHQKIPVLSTAAALDPHEDIVSDLPLGKDLAPSSLSAQSASPSQRNSPIPEPSFQNIPIFTPRPSPTPSPSPTPLKALAPVKLLPLLVGGQSTRSNKLSGELLSNFEIKLRWENYPEAEEYRIWFGATPNSEKALFEKVVHSNEFSFNRGKIYVGQFYYRIVAKLHNGRTASSSTENFSFTFLPPTPTLPTLNSRISKHLLKTKNSRVLLTWQKTNFTQKYEIEISKDANFTSLSAKQILDENFFILVDPSVGQYWWRVRGFTHTLSSPLSRPSSFTVIP